jgi:hypothetical protein
MAGKCLSTLPARANMAFPAHSAKSANMTDQLRYLGERNWIVEFMGRQLGRI